jgi:hypothetical protein
LTVARSHRRDWLDGYRKKLGLVTVVLNLTASR